MISDPIDGAPPEGMKPVPAGALQRAAQMTNITITLDKVTEEMLKAIMKKEGKYDGKKYISEKIKQIYMALIVSSRITSYRSS